VEEEEEGLWRVCVVELERGSDMESCMDAKRGAGLKRKGLFNKDEENEL